MSKKEINCGTTAYLITTIIVVACTYIFRSEIKPAITLIFENDLLAKFVWIYVVCVFGVHAHMHWENIPESQGLMYRQFGKFGDTAFSIGTYGFAGSTSASLCKGLYMQIMLDKNYFPEFSTLDLTSIFVVSSFLLIYCTVNTTEKAKEIVYHRKTTTTQ